MVRSSAAVETLDELEQNDLHSTEKSLPGSVDDVTGVASRAQTKSLLCEALAAEIRLLSEHQVVEYRPVPFPKKNIALWLPKDVELYFDFRKHRNYRHHRFDHFMLFSVDSGEKRNEPDGKPGQ